MHELFPAVPSDLAAAESDELRGLLDSIREIGASLRANTADLGGLTAEQVKGQLRAAVEASQAIKAELAARDEAEQNYVNDISELTAELGVEDQPEELEPVAASDELAADDDDPESESESDPSDPEELEGVAEDEPVGEVVPVAASADPSVVEVVDVAVVERRLAIPKGAKRFHAQPKSAEGASFTASAGLEGIREGFSLNKRALAEAMIAKRERVTSTALGNSENVVVASLNYEDRFPEDRILYNDQHADWAKIQDAVGVEALVASGGWCAPTVALHDVEQVSVADRPVRDALPSFNARRGGIRFTGAISIAEITTAITVVSSAQDLLGGTFAAKGCQEVGCPTIDEVLLQAISKCLEFGNMKSRAWPELVEAFNDAAMAAHARTAETELLDAIAAASTTTTRAAQYGATSTIIAGLLQAVAGMRSRHRLRPTTRFRALLPEWLPELLQNDLANQQFGRFDFTREGIETLLGRYGVRPTWYYDTATGQGQIFDAQADGVAVDPFPTTVNGYVFPEGSFLFLDGGRLDLGIVRDSVLNSTNDYQIFAETFENLAFVGVESIEIEWTVCPSGTVAIPATAITCP